MTIEIVDKLNERMEPVINQVKWQKHLNEIKATMKSLTLDPSDIAPPKFTAYVAKDGNDSYATGPFLTIGAAVTYLKTLALTSSQHGCVIIYPGTYNESLSFTSADTGRYIDIFGYDTNGVNIQNTADPVVYFNNTGNENQIFNITIEQTTGGGTAAALGLDNTASTFSIRNCRILSASRCLANMRAGTVKDCFFKTTVSTADDCILNLEGGIFTQNVVEAQSLAAGGKIIDTINSAIQEVSYCSFFGNTATNSDFVTSLNGKMTFCTATFGGSIDSVGSAGSLEHCTLDSTGIGTSPVVNSLSGRLFFTEIIQRQTSSQSTIATVAATGIIEYVNITQSNSSTAIASVTGGAIIRQVNIYSAQTTGYCITYDGSVGDTVMISEVNGPVQVDPRFIHTVQSFPVIESVVKTYLKRRWGAIQAGNATIYGVGSAVSTAGAGGLADSTDASGKATQTATGAVLNNTAEFNVTGYNETERRFNPWYYWKFRFLGTSGRRIYIGASSATTNNSDTLTVSFAGIRYSSASNTNFQFVTSTGAAQTVTNSGIAADTATHTLQVFIDDTNAFVVFVLDGTTIMQNTTNLPAATTDLGRNYKVTSLDAANKGIVMYDSFLEQDK